WASTLTLQAQLSKEPAQNQRNVSFLLSRMSVNIFPKTIGKYTKLQRTRNT
ncbi:unnamed protein product, partial [Brassica oleracea var. botrytis]